MIITTFRDNFITIYWMALLLLQIIYLLAVYGTAQYFKPYSLKL